MDGQRSRVAGAGGYFAPIVRGYMQKSGAPLDTGYKVVLKDRCYVHNFNDNDQPVLLTLEVGKGVTLVTPGVRMPGDAAGDQKRVVTPVDAIRRGADYIVVGRPITKATDPAAAARAIAASMRT